MPTSDKARPFRLVHTLAFLAIADQVITLANGRLADSTPDRMGMAGEVPVAATSPGPVSASAA